MFTFEKQTLLVIAPHPDDEVLGCAGLIQKVKKNHGKVFVQFLTIGKTQDFSQKGASDENERTAEIDAVAKFLQFDAYNIGFTGNDYHLKLDAHGQQLVMQLIERESPISIQKVKPSIVAFPSMYSYNQDHQLAARAAHSALRPAETANKHLVPLILAYEMPLDNWSMHHQNVPNFYVPLSKKEAKNKCKSMEYYTSQMRPHPNPRSLESIEALARIRGTMCGADFAEGYFCYRMIV